jgi:predicted TPR repeat methyltransferase
MAPASSQLNKTATIDTTLEAWERAKSLRQAGRPADAMELLRRGIKERPDDYRLHDQLGMAFGELGRQEEAIGAFLTALRLNPDFSEACSKIGSAFASRGMLEPARIWFQRAHQHDPNATDFLHHFGVTLVALGHLKEAAEIFEQWTKAEPDNSIARHLSDASIGSVTTAKAPVGYVRAVFDSYASRFDECLARLHYCAPRLVCEALQRFAVPPAGGWSVLDAGCGTGLAGLRLRPLARRLVGVDLSAGMLDVARQRDVYDELVEAEIIDYLGRQRSNFDVVTAADVLTYLGDLEEFFQSASHVLVPNGMIVVTVEASEGDQDYRLNPTGRFSHNPRYLRGSLERAGFEVKQLDDAVMRYEADRPVSSLIAVGASCAR